MMLIAVVILVLFGSKNVPKIARTIGRTMEQFRRAAQDVSSEIMQADPDLSSQPKLAALPDPEDAVEDELPGYIDVETGEWQGEGEAPFSEYQPDEDPFPSAEDEPPPAEPPDESPPDSEARRS